jgi:hypothetical protein
MKTKITIEEKKFLRQAILSSFPDLLDFDLSLNDYEKFVKQEATKEMLDDEIKFLNNLKINDCDCGACSKNIPVISNRLKELKKRIEQNDKPKKN